MDEHNSSGDRASAGMDFVLAVLITYLAGGGILTLSIFIAAGPGQDIGEFLQVWGSILGVVCILALMGIAGFSVPSVTNRGRVGKYDPVNAIPRHRPEFYASAALVGCMLITITGTLIH